MKWFNTLSHNRWLEQETDRIFNFGKNAAVPTGFGWLGNKGQIKEEMGTHLWITARMLHVYSVAASMGRPGAYDLVDHGIKVKRGELFKIDLQLIQDNQKRHNGELFKIKSAVV